MRAEAEELAGTVPDLDPASLTGFPALLAYDLLAVDRLGEPLVATLGEAAADQLPHEIAAALDDALLDAVEPPVTAAPAPSLADGDTLDGDATSWGRDLWYLALGAYLAPDQAGPASDAIAADLLTPVRRGDTACVYATFTPAAGAESVLELYLAQWTLNAPASAGATSQRLPDGTLQLVACDPGAGATTLPRTGVATELVDRVVARVPAP